MQDSIYFSLYRFFTSKEVTILRVFIALILLLIVLLFIDDFEFLIKLLPLYYIFFLQELFIHRKLELILPKKSTEKYSHIEETMTFNIRSDFKSNKSAFEISKEIAKTKEGKFVMQKIGQNNLADCSFSKEQIAEKAGDIVKSLGGKHISPLDFLVSYILCQEEKVRLLEKNDLDERDAVIILYWARKKFNVERRNLEKKYISGQGAFDFLVFGWTYETSSYTSDFTKEVLKLGYEPSAIGREKEYREVIEGLSKSSSKNILIIGDEGVGKTNLVMKFAYDAYKGNLIKELKNKRLYYLFVDRLISGVENKGELQERIVNILGEVSHSGNVILFIENIENIFGGGGFNLDVSGAIKPYLEGDRVQIIGTTSFQAHKEFISLKPALSSNFSEIDMKPPDKKIAIFMLLEEALLREKISNSLITYGAVKESVELSDSYDLDLVLPGSAVNLLEEAMVRNFQSGKRILTADNIKEIVNDRTGINVSEPTKEEKKMLLNIEDEIHRKLIGQDEAVTSVSSAIRRLRSGLRKNNGPIASFLFLGPTGVGKTTTAKLLAKEYFGSEEKMIRVDMSEYQSEDSIKKLLGEMPGEESMGNTFVDKIIERPFSVVLLDEFEKANPRLLDIFLQILDEGYVTDNRGKKVSFRNAIIIATSNAGSEFVRQVNDGKEIRKEELIEHILSKGIFRPELINRFSDIVVFHSLTKEQTLEISKLMLGELKEKLREQYIDISYSDSVIDKVASESFDNDFGARNVRRYIEENIENLVSRMILEEKIKKGENVLLEVDLDNNFVIKK